MKKTKDLLKKFDLNENILTKTYFELSAGELTAEDN